MSIDSPPVISVSRLTKYYGASVGVKDIDFTVHKGEIFGFLGPNGAGKTTTIRLILHLLRATSGEITLFGGPAGQKPTDVLKRCGYLPGEFSAYSQMTGVEFLRYAAAVRRIDPAGQKELIERFQISNSNLNKRVKQLSHGTLQKLGIVQAFFHRPELIILDEPTTGLDPLMQEEFYRLLIERRDEGATLFFSSHNLPEVERICSRVAIIRSGSLVALERLEVLKRKVARKLELRLKVELPEVSLPDAELIGREGCRYVFLVRGEMDALLKALTKLPVEDLLFPEAGLEEVFMSHYGRDNHD